VGNKDGSFNFTFTDSSKKDEFSFYPLITYDGSQTVFGK
jgi:hypothetical protein